MSLLSWSSNVLQGSQRTAGTSPEGRFQISDWQWHVRVSNIFRILRYMKTPFRILLILLFLAVLTPCFATDIVRIPPQYKKDTLSAPDPEYPMKAQHLGYQGQGIYRLVINDKTGIVDEVKVVKTAGHRELDASAIMTLFNWKFRPGVNHRDLLIVFELTGWVRGLH
jgi:TonB family protein